MHDCAFIRDLGCILCGIGNLRVFCLFPFFFFLIYGCFDQKYTQVAV